MGKETQKIQTVAVIDIGTSAIRMLIAELAEKSEIRYLENVQQPVNFGKEVFTTGKISNKSMREGVMILKNFKEMTETYHVQRIHAIATSAVREAVNRDNFVDQVYVRTGIDVEVIEGPEENRLQLIAVNYALEGVFSLEERNCLIIEVGSGSTELIVLNQGQVEIARTLSMGSIRLPDHAVAGKTDSSTMQRVLKRNIHEIAAHAAREYKIKEVDTLIALGGDMRFACQQLSEKQSDRYMRIERKEFYKFVMKLSRMSPEETAAHFNIPYGQAETLYPSLLVYYDFLSETDAEELIVPMVSIRIGLLLELAQLFSGYKRTDVSKQVINSARHLAEKYQYDKTHASNVASLSIKLFDAFKQEHGMGTKERLLLEVAAILHDIGVFVSQASHHKHSSYLIQAAEIFGLRKEDKDIIANVVRYHRRAMPRPEHTAYMSLPKPSRAVVSKLAAILRVADSLDHGHQQRIKNFKLEKEEDVYTLWVKKEIGDVSIERESLRTKGKMFSEVFGSPVQLKQGDLGE